MKNRTINFGVVAKIHINPSLMMRIFAYVVSYVIVWIYFVNHLFMETVMATLARLNATIPTPLDQYADVRVETGDFGNKSEYIRHLIREDRERHLQSEVTLINQMIQAGRDSGTSDKTPAEILTGAKTAISKAQQAK